jgi:hypothetical protein
VEPVRCPRLYRDHVARVRDELVVSDVQPELALEHFAALGLVRVNVSRGDEPVRLDDRLDQDARAIGLVRGAVEDQRLAGGRVGQCVSVLNHLSVLSSRRVVVTNRLIDRGGFVVGCAEVVRVLPPVETRRPGYGGRSSPRLVVG